MNYFTILFGQSHFLVLDDSAFDTVPHLESVGICEELGLSNRTFQGCTLTICCNIWTMASDQIYWSLRLKNKGHCFVLFLGARLIFLRTCVHGFICGTKSFFFTCQLFAVFLAKFEFIQMYKLYTLGCAGSMPWFPTTDQLVLMSLYLEGTFFFFFFACWVVQRVPLLTKLQLNYIHTYKILEVTLPH